MIASGPVQGPVAATTERALLILFASIRLAAIGQVAWVFAFAWNRCLAPLATMGVLVAVVVESAVAIGAGLRRGVLDSRLWMLVDVGFATVTLVIGAMLMRRSANPVTDNVFYPYAVTSLSAAGLVLRSLPCLLAAPIAAAACYAGVIAARFGLTSGLGANAFTYLAYAVIGWVIARTFRRLSHRLDEAHEAAVARESELVRERIRIARDLHDRVLQTMEFLARGDYLPDCWVRDHVAEEVSWLRQNIECALGRPQHFAAALQEVVRQQTRAGLRVETNISGMGDAAVPGPVSDAVMGAVTEALTNVRKHAGTACAVLRVASTPTKLTVTVLDRGCGFDTAMVTAGFGVAQSIIARIEQAGGSAAVTSFPGEGTHVVISVPIAKAAPPSAEPVVAAWRFTEPVAATRPRLGPKVDVP